VVAGIKKEDIKIEFKSGVLTVSGEQRMEKTDKSEQWHRAERLTGKFIRQFRLTDGDMESIKASLENGVLVVNVPKVEKKGGEVKVISIESGGNNQKSDEL
jgi:HSP20 family protein